MAHEVSDNLFGRDTCQRTFFQSDKTVSGALSDVLNSDLMNEITICAHSQLKLLLFLSFATPSLSWLSNRRTRGFYNALGGAAPTGLSLLSRLIERVCPFTLL